MISQRSTKRDDPDRPESQGPNEDVDEQNQHYQEPTERTRLLPREERHEFLSPDDPAVCTALVSSIFKQY